MRDEEPASLRKVGAVLSRVRWEEETNLSGSLELAVLMFLNWLLRLSFLCFTDPSISSRLVCSLSVLSRHSSRTRSRLNQKYNEISAAALHNPLLFKSEEREVGGLHGA